MGKRNKRKAKSRSLTRTKENSQKRKVHFMFQAPDAKEVCLAGEFNGWHTQTLPMIKDENGAWNAAIELTIGRHEYKLFVDGTWMEDRSCEVFVERGPAKLILESQSIINSYGIANYAFCL